MMVSEERSPVDEPFILPADVLITPVERLAPRVRQAIECDDGDFAVTRSGLRTPSRIVDADLALLLEEFREPTRLVDAIISFSRKRNYDPELALEKAFGALQAFCNTKVLVLADSEDAQIIGPSYAVGQEVAGYEIVRVVQILEDSELYQAQDRTGTVALKVLRRGCPPLAFAMIEREVAILRHSGGVHSPQLIASGLTDGRAYLATRWCPGVPVTRRAQELRASAAPNWRKALRDLCCSVLAAYRSLHERGIIHGDVHPGNILVDADGTVTIIDFGLAHLQGLDGEGVPNIHRAGVAAFYEPEMARALLENSLPPPASALGEQYALASLLYLLITGEYYLMLSAEQERLLRQVIEEDPLPFARRGFEPWPAVEAVLRKALSKEPEARFQSVGEFLAALKRAPLPRSRPARPGSPPHRNPGLDLLDSVLETVRLDGPLFRHGLDLAPRASVNYGSAGIAWFLYRLSLIREDPSLLALSDAWAIRSQRESPDERAFYDPGLGITSETVGSVSPFHTASGLHCVQGLIDHARGDRGGLQTQVDAFIELSRQRCDILDLSLGRSGSLLACSLLLDCLSCTPMVERGRLLAFTQHTLNEITEQVGSWGSIAECRAMAHLGIAHGWAGVIYAILRACRSTGAKMPDMIPARLSELAGLRRSFGRGVAWPGLAHDSGLISPSVEYAPGWCAGSAGYVHLWVLAHEVYGDESYLKLAEQSAWYAWEQSGGGADLCCGLAGRAFALLRLYQYTGASEWRDRAHKLAMSAANLRKGWTFRRPMSLYRGKLGPALVAAEMEAPERAAMPLFGPEGWPGTVVPAAGSAL